MYLHSFVAHEYEKFFDEQQQFDVYEEQATDQAVAKQQADSSITSRPSKPPLDLIASRRDSGKLKKGESEVVSVSKVLVCVYKI